MQQHVQADEQSAYAMPMRIDAHQHFWQLARGDYGWLNRDLAPLYRDFLPVDLAPLLRAADLRGSVLVQAATTDAETDFLLQLATAHDFVLGVVGWVDLLAPGANERLHVLAKHPRFKGVRPMLQDIADPAWMLQPALAPAIHTLIELDLSFDALVRPNHLANLLTFTRRYPALRVVIDHAAKPLIASSALQPWQRDTQALAAESTVLCKFSGLVTEAGAHWQPADIAPYAAHLLHCFGSDRLMWGSDWPVLLMASDYTDWLALSESLLAPCSDAERAQIFGGTAARFYRLASPLGATAATTTGSPP